MVGGTASMIKQFNMNNINLLLSMGCKVDVACNFKEGNNFSKKEIDELQHQLTVLGITYYQIDFSRKVTNIRSDVRAYKQVLQLLKQKKYDFVHCHMPIVSVLVRKACNKIGIPVIYTVHGFHFFNGAPLKNWLMYYPIEKYYSRYTNVLITINREDYKRAYKKFDAKKIVYIPGVGVDTTKFSSTLFCDDKKNELRKSLGVQQNAIMLLSVGELSKRKNHVIVIKALSEISNKNVHYCIAGIGCLHDELRDLACKLGVSERVHLLGFRKDIKELCLTSDIFVFPSLQEGLPVALMEAMSCGMPCVVAKIRGNTELIDNNGGRLFNAFSIRDCTKAITELIEITPAQRNVLGFYNRNKMKHSFEIHSIENDMREVYMSFIN